MSRVHAGAVGSRHVQGMQQHVSLGVRKHGTNALSPRASVIIRAFIIVAGPRVGSVRHVLGSRNERLLKRDREIVRRDSS